MACRHAAPVRPFTPARCVGNLLVLMAAAVPLSAAAQSNILISSAYAGGSGASATYNRDYIELVNRSTSAASLNGLHLQSASAVGNFASVEANVYSLPNVTLQPGQFYLIECGGIGGTGAAVPSPDATTTSLNLTNNSGKVALTNTATPLGGGETANPIPLPDARILDLVSYGASNNAEGGVPVNNGTTVPDTQTARRKLDGQSHIQDTDNNNGDYELITPTGGDIPRNTGSSFATVPVSLSGFTID